jgi:hypothetical protein
LTLACLICGALSAPADHAWPTANMSKPHMKANLREQDVRTSCRYATAYLLDVEGPQ